MSYKLYLDDQRKPVNDGFILVKDIDEFKEMVLTFGLPEAIAFDHDLGQGLGREGIDAVNWLIDEMRFDLRNCDITCHSDNWPGKQNILGKVASWRKHVSKG